jgi:hypothetical protein
VPGKMDIELFKTLPRELWSKIIIFVSQMRIVEYFNEINEKAKIPYICDSGLWWYNIKLKEKIIKMNLKYFKIPQIIEDICSPVFRDDPGFTEVCMELQNDYDLDLNDTLNVINNMNGIGVIYLYVVQQNIKSVVIIQNYSTSLNRGVVVITGLEIYNINESDVLLNHIINKYSVESIKRFFIENPNNTYKEYVLNFLKKL